MSEQNSEYEKTNTVPGSLDEAAAGISEIFARAESQEEEVEVEEVEAEEVEEVEIEAPGNGESEEESEEEEMEASSDDTDVEDVDDTSNELTEWEGIEELLEAGGTDMDSVPVSINTDDGPQRVTLKEVVEGYQAHRDAGGQVKALSAARESLEAQSKSLHETSQRLEQNIQATALFLDDEINAIEEEYEKVDWKNLRSKDVGQYNALRGDFQEAREKAKARKNDFLAKVEEMRKEHEAEFKEKVAEQGKQERKLLAEKTGWKDGESKELRSNAKAAMDYMVKEYGLQPADINRMGHVDMIVAWKAMKYDEAASRGKSVLKNGKKGKVRPKARRIATLRPGSSRPGASTLAKKAKKVKEAEEKVKKTGSIDDAAAAFSARWSD